MQKTAFYETIYLLRPNLTEEDILKTIETYQTLLIKQGSQVITQNKGRRHLMYPIKGYSNGFYIQMNFDGNGKLIDLLEKFIKLNDDVIRYITIKQKHLPSNTSTTLSNVYAKELF